jgi:hypothetical protein
VVGVDDGARVGARILEEARHDGVVLRHVPGDLGRREIAVRGLLGLGAGERTAASSLVVSLLTLS